MLVIALIRKNMLCLTGERFELILLSWFICLVYCSYFSHSSRDHIELRFWTVENGINARFGTNVYQALDRLKRNTDQLYGFLLTIADQSLTETQILERSGLTQSEVDYLMCPPIQEGRVWEGRASAYRF